MSIHRYPNASLVPDGLRAVFGIAFTVGPLTFLDLAWPVTVMLIGLGVVFLLFAFRVLEHGLCPIELSADGIVSSGPVVRCLTWNRMTMLKLTCYATPKRPSDGWYQLTLRGDDGRALKVDSTIDGFEVIVAAAVTAAEAGRMTYDPATEDNLRSLGQLPAQGG